MLNNKRTYIVILIILACAAYINSLPNAFISDDIPGIAENNAINKLSNVTAQPMFFLRPLFYWGISGLFGETAIFFRLVNILFHLGAVVAAYLLISRLHTPLTAFFAAAIFAVHPIATEAVTWISGGPYSQCGFFLLLALLFFNKREGKRRFYSLSLISFFLALVSGITAIVLPLILIVFLICFGKFKGEWEKTLPFFGLGLVWATAGLLQINNRNNIIAAVYSQKTEWLNPFIQIPFAVTSYLQLIFWPDKLTLYHSELAINQNEYLLRLALFVIFLLIMIYSFKRQHKVFFWCAFFFICLLPTLTPLGISSVVAERYAYLASLGIFTLVGLAFSRLRNIKNFRLTAYAIFFAVICALLIRTVIRNLDWRSEDRLWTATVALSPSSPNAHNNMGDVYSRAGDLSNALKEFSRAIELKPDYAAAWHNLASTYLAMGKLQEAGEAYKKAVLLNPRLWESYQDLAVLYFRRNDLAAARDNATKAIELNPSELKLHHNLAMINLKLEQADH
ncbi:MAG: tetratricopeptide repeat protein [Candidatus Omnitrophota bacterium]